MIRIRELIGFYENELTNNILYFWLPRCVDEVNGGYFNCFDNAGGRLLSRDKYIWSQGRFVWLFSKLSMMDCGTFSAAERERFLALAKSGRDFLLRHCLLGAGDWRCVFLTDERGDPKLAEGCDRLDMSIYVDCFVVLAFGKYAEAAGDRESYDFAKNLYESAIARIRSGRFNTLPYPLSPSYRAHGIPMIFSNVTRELCRAAKMFDKPYLAPLSENLKGFTEDVLTNFVDENDVLHEIVTAGNGFFRDLLGRHVNPGHTLEDMWFMMEAEEALGAPRYGARIAAIVKKTFELGWDEEFGGLLHYCGVNGGAPSAGPDDKGIDEPMRRQVVEGWSDKLWWVHSEALYTTLLCFARTGDEEFLRLYRKVFDYSFKTFPNPDREIREWIQIRKRDGAPQDKVVALPVKDPYHIARNFIQIIELLYGSAERASSGENHANRN